jgi:DNA-binding response OmpR family regulator
MTSTRQKIALIEDDFNIQYMYKLKLEISGFEVATASNGHEGIELVRSFQPDLIMLDLKMPLMSGEEMLIKLRESDWGSDFRVIILTNISRSEAPQSLGLLNVDRFIVKAHFTPAQIVEIIRETLSENGVHSR